MLFHTSVHRQVDATKAVTSHSTPKLEPLRLGLMGHGIEVMQDVYFKDNALRKFDGFARFGIFQISCLSKPRRKT